MNDFKLLFISDFPAIYFFANSLVSDGDEAD
jgi:hypothetical protein